MTKPSSTTQIGTNHHRWNPNHCHGPETRREMPTATPASRTASIVHSQRARGLTRSVGSRRRVTGPSPEPAGGGTAVSPPSLTSAPAPDPGWPATFSGTTPRLREAGRGPSDGRHVLTPWRGHDRRPDRHGAVGGRRPQRLHPVPPRRTPPAVHRRPHAALVVHVDRELVGARH